ncbi:MAG: hypothetical protein IJZ62_01475, partial [Clostridia bacterium]|nr:hypothetical protein [Clostridia bacterium]
MKPVLKRKIIATLVVGSLLFHVYSMVKIQEKTTNIDTGYSSNAQKLNSNKQPIASLPKEKITGKINLNAKKKRLNDEKIDITI